MVKAVIFDMDGLLIDSEPLWGRAKDKVLDELGVTISQQDIHDTLGQGIHNAVDHWYRKYGWNGLSPDAASNKIIDEFMVLVKAEGKMKPGVMHVIKICQQAGLPLAIASSSPMEIIDAVVDKLKIRQYFSEIYSARQEPFSKPHPGVFISVAKLLKVSPHDCLVFEDAPAGVLAAKSAKMHCIAVPEPDVKSHKFIQTADLVLDSLEQFSESML